MSQRIPEFFTARPFLEERLGPEWFDTVPASPGVYRFYDADGKLLYVGKAKSLRTRLFGYKRAKSGGVSGKVSRLITRIASFEIQVTESEQEALLLENRLIRENRPPFNHANKQPETYYFVCFRPDDTGLEFRLAMRIHDETDERFWYGCFKGHTPVRSSFGCLLQMLWMAENGVINPMYLPVQLTRYLIPMHYHLHWTDNSPMQLHDVPDMLHNWMLGESYELLDWFTAQLSDSLSEVKTPFQVRYIEHHLDCLKTFYDRKLLRHRKLRGGRQRIEQEEIDDAIVHWSVSSNMV